MTKSFVYKIETTAKKSIVSRHQEKSDGKRKFELKAEAIFSLLIFFASEQLRTCIQPKEN